ncbi:FAD-dependent oxidoreductase [Shewanella canadensis]|uniref:FAD-dependent oxidoreductase n=1 Tax=Shewanella canadensis TaxID=271096 RepID=A0A431WQA7_9GAMM|nr:FAD-dependent oxidoreductase [Shewanella canadensis]RTR37716.1 FAD-dependent oxidoreductase [Shewanella canadensis]
MIGVDLNKLQPSYSGIRPKLQGPGDSFRDFQIQGEVEHGFSGLVNLYGIESSGLTASLAIARYVADKLTID